MPVHFTVVRHVQCFCFGPYQNSDVSKMKSLDADWTDDQCVQRQAQELSATGVRRLADHSVRRPRDSLADMQASALVSVVTHEDEGCRLRGVSVVFVQFRAYSERRIGIEDEDRRL